MASSATVVGSSKYLLFQAEPGGSVSGLALGTHPIVIADAAGLGRLKAAECAPAIESVLRTLPEQNHPRIRRILMEIRGDSGDKSDAAKLREDFEKLEDRNRKIEERLAAIEASRESEREKKTEE